MSRKITEKTVQVHFQYDCGYNEVHQDYFSVKWKDLSKQGIKRKKDKKTGEYFLFTKIDCTNRGEY